MEEFLDELQDDEGDECPICGEDAVFDRYCFNCSQDLDDEVDDEEYEDDYTI